MSCVTPLRGSRISKTKRTIKRKDGNEILYLIEVIFSLPESFMQVAFLLPANQLAIFFLVEVI